jgi:hypothetical protein
MRNAGEGPPGGSTGRRQRVPAQAGTGQPTANGGASLFTPAYRVRHAAVPSEPDQDGFGRAPSRSSGTDYGTDTTGQLTTGYDWSDADQPVLSYRQADLDSGAADGTQADDISGGGYSWMTDGQSAGANWPSLAAGGAGTAVSRLSNAIRGLPPVPDEPLPSYPPGPFAAWNRRGSDGRDAATSTAGNSADLFARQDQGAHPLPAEGSARMLSTATITPDEFDTNHSLPAIKDPVLTQGRAATGLADRGTPAGSRPGSRAKGAQPRAAAPARDRLSAGRSSSRKKARGGRGSRRQSVRLAIGAAAVIVAAVAAILVVTSLSKPGPSQNANSKANRPRVTASPTPPAGKWGYIGSRQTDPVPLALPELFPASFITGGAYYHAAISKEGLNCHAAMIGTALQAAVKKAGCSQVLRASYVARQENAMATIGVFNLATSTAASTVAQHAGHAEFVAELPAKVGVTTRIGEGSGVEEAIVKGHYLVLCWAEFIDLSTPKTKWQRQHLTGFMNTLIQQTINRSLSYRMVDGKPASSGQGQ